MKISTKGRYALEAIVDLAVHAGTEVECLKNIAVRLDLSKNYLDQIFTVLRKKGIVESVLGACGGYRLARDPGAITAGEILRAVEGNLSPVACLEKGKCTQTHEEADYCVAHNLWKKLMNEINTAADGVTIADLVDGVARLNNDDPCEYYI